MRTNIDINDILMQDVLKAGGFKTKREAVEESLRLFIRTKNQGRLKQLRGKLKWDGALEDMRRDT
ncbi:type II toxin-antitoxin system VapB family antitoxin [Hellea balneolensis]|uniref:type II toxin-antitoxin system VapB family antitoxin n=1 Tax=Hellea balneolensis TaxID=287478 RepID=UPI0003FDDA94|nr:type II toxin-antitoxin system VapB family antitoxin [Hellea balneolensis]